jgi:glucose-6-phosphate 1-dehydrogenase
MQERDDAFRRVIIEKPFGNDLQSARDLNARILKQMDESQVFRIDHFLGKEPVQSIMALRFANGLFEPMWRREFVDHVQITAAETIGVEKRGSFYESTGALRDMVPNHLFQLLTMTAMEPPNSFDADDVRTEKAKLVEAIRQPPLGNVVRAQYGPGRAQGKEVLGYRQEPDVSKDSRTETYVALKLAIENWRWSGVPFYLRTGKRLKNRLTTIAVHFKPAPYQIFRDTPVDRLTPNVLTLQIAPDQSVATDFSAKVPGPTMKLGRVSAEFRYDDFFDEGANVGYETLLYDCMIGDATLFQRADNIEAGWAVVQPLLEAWGKGDGALETYDAGSEGPQAADDLLRRDGRRWLPLTPEPEKRRNAESH